MNSFWIIYANKPKECVLIDEKMDKKVYPISLYRKIRNILKANGLDYYKTINKSRKLLDVYQKPPLIIDAKKQFIIFPLYSYRNQKNIFINYGCIVSVKAQGDKYSVIKLRNGSNYCIKVNIRIIKRQMNRCNQLLKLYF